MRRALALAAALLASAALAPAVLAPAALAQTDALRKDGVLDARLILSTGRYDHAVLGDGLEWGAMEIIYKHCLGCRGLDLRRVVIELPESRVFEDVEARVADLDGDGLAEVLVVETDLARGASLAVYGPRGKIAATPFIGQRHRWLAPAGVGDFDGDGRPEIAYVDRPHLARELVFLRLEAGRLTEIARAPGFSNHRIGETDIASAVRRCGSDALLMPDLDRRRLLAIRLDGRSVSVGDAGPWTGEDAFARAAAC